MEWRENDGVRWLEAELGDARAAFFARQGGVSEPPFDRLNLGLLTDDAAENVTENRRRLAAALDIAPERIAYGRQVHGTELATAPPSFRGSFATSETTKEPRELEAVDGQVVREPGVAGLVFTADCLPVALAGPGGVAMLHCGWRGLSGGIVAKGAAAVGASEAAIGPGVGPRCYEVGDEVIARFESLGEGIADGRLLDLPEVARRLLAEAGVERVQSAGRCTHCEPDLFFSHRRDAGRTGRQGNLAWLGVEGGGG